MNFVKNGEKNEKFTVSRCTGFSSDGRFGHGHGGHPGTRRRKSFDHFPG